MVRGDYSGAYNAYTEVQWAVLVTFFWLLVVGMKKNHGFWRASTIQFWSPSFIFDKVLPEEISWISKFLDCVISQLLVGIWRMCHFLRCTYCSECPKYNIAYYKLYTHTNIIIYINNIAISNIIPCMIMHYVSIMYHVMYTHIVSSRSSSVECFLWGLKVGFECSVLRQPRRGLVVFGQLRAMPRGRTPWRWKMLKMF